MVAVILLCFDRSAFRGVNKTKGLLWGVSVVHILVCVALTHSASLC